MAGSVHPTNPSLGDKGKAHVPPPPTTSGPAASATTTYVLRNTKRYPIKAADPVDEEVEEPDYDTDDYIYPRGTIDEMVEDLELSDLSAAMRASKRIPRVQSVQINDSSPIQSARTEREPLVATGDVSPFMWLLDVYSLFYLG